MRRPGFSHGPRWPRQHARAPWPRFPTGALLLALEMLPYQAPWVKVHERLAAEEGDGLRFTADVAGGIWTLREVLEERGVV